MSEKLVLIRHGESLWNKENKFTGWVDVDLSPNGVEEAKRAAGVLKEFHYNFDLCYTSVLKRSIRTAWVILSELDRMWIPTVPEWRLNERHYGSLQGLNKVELAQKYGAEQIFQWRRSFDVLPPSLPLDHVDHPTKDPRYSSIDPRLLPSSEALKQTLERVLPFWQNTLFPMVKAGKRLLVVAHGNSLRALIMHLEHLSIEEVSELNIPTASPLVYEWNSDFDRPNRYYLENSEDIKERANAVASQAVSNRNE